MTAIAGELDRLRLAVGEVEALAAVLLMFFDSSDWSGTDSLTVDRTGYMLTVLAESAGAAVGKFERFQVAFVDARPVSTPVERWTDEGTSPGKDALSARDVVIVKHLRDGSPDGRFEGSTDLELIELFRRNKQVLARSDEDVIAAMTRPR